MRGVAAELGRIAAEMEQLAREWRAAEADSAGPEVLLRWRTRLVLAAREIGSDEAACGQ